MISNILGDHIKKGGKIDFTPRLSSDSIEFMEVYIAHMRVNKDFDTIPDMLNRFNDQLFTGKATSLDHLRQLAVYATDRMYRHAAELKIRDAYTVVYFKQVIAGLMKSLQEKGVEVFYIIDNEIRQDRFKLAVMLYEWSGATVITPYIGDKILGFKEVEEQLKNPMALGRNIVYIEKDASVNYIEKVMGIATGSRYIGIFRNFEPSVDYLKIL